MKDPLVVVGISRVDAETESVEATQDKNGAWLFQLPQDAAAMAVQALDQLDTSTKQHIHTVIVTNAAEDSHARQRCIMTEEKSRPRDVLSALGTNLVLILKKYFPQVENIFKIDAACASGMYALEVAEMVVRSKNVVVAVAGVDKSTAPFFVNMFRSLGALAQSKDQYHTPFNVNRCGFAMGEGAGIIAITTQTHADTLGLPTLAYIDTINTKTIVTHPTDPSDSTSMVEFIQSTIRASHHVLDDFAYWDAHATATPTGDLMEYQLFANIFKNTSVAFSSFKGRVGHCMCASSLIEIIQGIQSLQKQQIPANYLLKEPMANDQRLLATSLPTLKKTFIKTSFAFGGRNGAAVITVK